MQDDDCLVFVEVRVRSPSHWSDAAESVGPEKQRKLTLAAEDYLSRRKRWTDGPVRFDVVAIQRDGASNGEPGWIADAFRPGW